MSHANALRTKIETGYYPRPLQAYIHANLKRFNVLVVHRRFGKTVLSVNEIIDRAFRCPGFNPQYAYLAPTYGQAEKIAWDMFKKYTQNLPGVEYNQTKLSITIPRPWKGDRIKIMLLGAENPDSLRGIYLDGCVLDEYGQMHPSVWGEVIRPALADRQGWAIFIGTPKGQNDFYEKFKLALKNESGEWLAITFKASQTKVLPEEEMESMKSEMSEEQWDQEMECSFTAANTGSYWGKLISKAESEGRITRLPHDPSLLVSTWWDLGVGDTTAVWFVQQSRLEIRVIDHMEMSGEGIEYYARQLKSGHRGDYNYDIPHNWPHDGGSRDLSTGNERSTTARQLGVRVHVHPRYDVADSINAVRKILPRCHFDAVKCARGLEALKAYQRKWDEKNKIWMDKPLHDWASHSADAFRLLGMGLRPESATKRSDLPRRAQSSYDVFNPQGNRNLARRRLGR